MCGHVHAVVRHDGSDRRGGRGTRGLRRHVRCRLRWTLACDGIHPEPVNVLRNPEREFDSDLSPLEPLHICGDNLWLNDNGNPAAAMRA